MNDGEYGLRVDHISDVVWLSGDSERIPLAWQRHRDKFMKNAMGLKDEGNRALKAGQPYEAAEL